jgi:DNA-binding beta-propeller fold protein YncE
MKGLQGVWLAVMAGLAMAGCARPPETVAPPPDDPGPGVTADYTPGQVSVAPQIQLARPNLAASTLAGTGTAGKRDGAAGQAQFQAPEGVAVAADGTVFVAEPYAYRIRQISPSGTVSTLAGGAGGTPGRADGVGSLASFMGPKDVAIAPNGDLYVVDFDGVRRVTRDGHVSTLALHNADGSEYQPIELFGIACDRSGTLYLSATTWIDRVTPDGAVSRYAGNDARGFADGPAARAYFNLPHKLALDAGGSLFVADYGNQRVRRIGPDRTVSTIAGNGILGFTDGPAEHSRLNFPAGVAVDAQGDVIVADTFNHAIRQVSPDGAVRTLAGTNAPGLSNTAGAIQFNQPSGVAIRPDGGIVVADRDNAVVRLLR